MLRKFLLSIGVFCVVSPGAVARSATELSEAERSELAAKRVQFEVAVVAKDAAALSELWHPAMLDLLGGKPAAVEAYKQLFADTEPDVKFEAVATAVRRCFDVPSHRLCLVSKTLTISRAGQKQVIDGEMLAVRDAASRQVWTFVDAETVERRGIGTLREILPWLPQGFKVRLPWQR